MERFEIVSDGPERWVVVDNYNPEPSAPVFRSRLEAEQAIEDAGLIEYGIALKSRLSLLWRLLGFNKL